MLLQNFDFRFDDPSYQLQVKQTLTVKPKDFYMHATLRGHIDPVNLDKLLHLDTSKREEQSDKDKKIAQSFSIHFSSQSTYDDPVWI